MNFSVIATCGLTQSEFATLADVGRVTVNTWVRGRMQPHRYIKDEVAALLLGLAAAAKRGDLPLPPDVRRPAARVKAIRWALASK